MDRSPENNEPHHEKTGFLLIAKTKALISCAVTAQLISAFVFATNVQSQKQVRGLNFWL